MDTTGQNRPRPLRRLLAFVFDTFLFMLPINIVWVIINPDSYVMFSSIYSGIAYAMLTLVTAIPAMAFCARRFSSTPGKWLLGIKMKLPPEASFTMLYKRQIFAYILGAGLLFPPLTLFTLYITFQSFRATGLTQWDRRYKTEVTGGDLKGGRITAFVLILAIGSGATYIPMFYDTFEQYVMYLTSPAYCTVSLSSGSVKASEELITLSARADGGQVPVKSSGLSFSLGAELGDIDSLTVGISKSFSSLLSEDASVELELSGEPDGMLALGIDMELLGRDGGSPELITTVTAVNRQSQLVVYEQTFTSRLAPSLSPIKILLDMGLGSGGGDYNPKMMFILPDNG